jgi:tetratricopeptide (TPR) repeat protein
MGNVRRVCAVLAALCVAAGLPAEARPATAGVPDNMAKFGPRLSEEELAQVARLSVPELADMLRNGDTMHAYAALHRLKADGGVNRNLHLLLSIAAETRGDMIVEGLARPVEASAGDEEKQVVDKLLGLLEAELGKAEPSVSPAQAARSIGQAVAKELSVPPGHLRGDAQDVQRRLAPPHGFDRAVPLLVSCLESEDTQARREAATWLGQVVGAYHPEAVGDVAAKLRAWLAEETARAQKLDDEQKKAGEVQDAEGTLARALRQIQRDLETRERILSPERLARGGTAAVTREWAAMDSLWAGDPPERVMRRRAASLEREFERLSEEGRHDQADGLIAEIESTRRRLQGDAFSETDFAFEWKVRQARRYDPMCSRDRDRDRAAELYREALALRPGDPRNIEVEYRIAEMYAFHADPQAGVKTDPARAAEAFAHIIETYPPTQERWVHSHFGMAGTGVMQGRLGGALHWYRKVLEDVDPEAMAAPLGKEVFGTDRPDKAQRERAVEAAERSRLRAVERIAYVAGAMGPDEQAKQLSDIAARYRGTPAGDRAAELLRETLSPGLAAIADGAADGLLPHVELTAAGPVAAEAARVDRPASPQGPDLTSQPDRPAPVAAGIGAVRYPWQACAVGAGAAALVVCALLLVRRWRRNVQSAAPVGGDARGTEGTDGRVP